MADKIKFSDLFNLNDSNDLEKAIKLISDMDKVYDKLAKGIKSESSKIEKALSSNVKAAEQLSKTYSALNTTTDKGQKQTVEYATASDKLFKSTQQLEKAQKVQITNLDKLKKEQAQLNKQNEKVTHLDKERLRLMDRLNKANSSQAKGTAALRLAISQKNKEVKEAARESLGLISVYQRESKQLNDLRKKYKDVALTQGQSSKEAKRLAREVKQLDTRLKSVDASAGQFQRNVGNYPQVFKAGIAAVTGIAFAVVGFVRAVGRAIKITRDYQDANATLAGILGRTASETQKLQRQQLELGKSTEFSASQVAKAQTELARLGQTEENIIAMTPGILSAATALQTDLASAAELVAGQLNAFGLEANKSSEVADVLTKSTQISALNFERLSTALAIVSPAARASGVSIQRTTAILGAAADANIDASSAATALRNIYIDIADKGLTFEDAMLQITNSTNKLTAANQLFGKRGAVVASVIADQTEKINTNTIALENAAGTADEFAKVQLNTLSGEMKLLNSAFEGLVLSVEDGEGSIGKFLRAFISGLTNLLGWLESVNESVDELMGKLKDTAETEVASKAVEKLTSRFKELQEAGSKLTLEEVGTKMIDNLVSKTQQLNEEYFINSERLDYINRLIDNNNTEKLTAEMLKEREELEKSIPQYATKINLLNKSITAIEKYITEQKESNKVVVESTGEFVRQDIVLLKVLNTQGLLALKLKELNGLYKVLYGETLEESEQAFEAANQSFLDRMDAEINSIAERYKKEQEQAKETARIVAEAEKQKKQNYIDAAFAGVDAINGLFERRVQAKEQELQLLQEQNEEELAIAEENREGTEIIRKRQAEQEKQLQREIAEERRKQAIFNKTIAIADIVINTAVGITKTIAQLGLPAALPFVISAGALGALQTAAVLAQPIPAFAEGTDNAPGGLAWVGEEGREIVVAPNKQAAYVTPNEATLVDLPEGSQVLTNSIAENILSGNDTSTPANEKSNKDLQSIVGTRVNAENQKKSFEMLIAKENDMMLKQLENMVFNQPINQFYFEDGDLKTAMKKGNTTVKNANKKYKFSR